MAKKKAQTSNERQIRHVEKMAKFDIRKVYVKASGSQRLLLEKLVDKLGYSNREELILSEMTKLGASMGFHLSDLNKELKNEKK